jgi:hypothetical protein
MELIHQSKSIAASTLSMVCVQFDGGKITGCTRNLWRSPLCQLMGSSWHFFQWQCKAKQIPVFHLLEVALSAPNPINSVVKIASENACSLVEKILEFCQSEQMWMWAETQKACFLILKAGGNNLFGHSKEVFHMLCDLAKY